MSDDPHTLIGAHTGLARVGTKVEALETAVKEHAHQDHDEHYRMSQKVDKVGGKIDDVISHARALKILLSVVIGLGTIAGAVFSIWRAS